MSGSIFEYIWIADLWIFYIKHFLNAWLFYDLKRTLDGLLYFKCMILVEKIQNVIKKNN